MTIRPFQLPQDINLMNCLVMEEFQCPQNPDWNVQEDEHQGTVNRIVWTCDFSYCTTVK